MMALAFTASVFSGRAVAGFVGFCGAIAAFLLSFAMSGSVAVFEAPVALSNV